MSKTFMSVEDFMAIMHMLLLQNKDCPAFKGTPVHRNYRIHFFVFDPSVRQHKSITLNPGDCFVVLQNTKDTFTSAFGNNITGGWSDLMKGLQGTGHWASSWRLDIFRATRSITINMSAMNTIRLLISLYANIQYGLDTIEFI